MIPHPSTVHVAGDLHRKELLALVERERLAVGCLRAPANTLSTGLRRKAAGTMASVRAFARSAIEAVVPSRPALR
jgi:hypothetical protein